MRRLIALLFLLALPLAAAPIAYQVTVNTSLIAGLSGYSLDLQLNPGNAGSQALSAVVSSFAMTGGALAGTPDPIGNVAGALPGTVTIANSTPLNSYFDYLTAGTGMSFLLTLSGAAIDSPNGTATAGTTFAMLFYDPQFNGALSVEPSGVIGQIDIGLDGKPTITCYKQTIDLPTAITFTPVGNNSNAPEPATFALLGASLAALSAWRRFRRQ